MSQTFMSTFAVSLDSRKETLSKIKAQFANVLEENEAPSENTIALLKTTLTPWKNQLQNIERTISEINLKLATLHSQHEEVQIFISSFDGAFSPLRRLSDDVMAEIFHHCLPTHRNPMPATSESPLILTLVCQRWRSVALSSPRLWNRLHIAFQLNVTNQDKDPDRLFVGKWQLRLKGIKSWIARSCILPLSISMHGTILGPIDAQSNDIERQFLQIIKNHASRLQSLELCLPLESLNTLHAMIDITPSNLPVLRLLKVMEMEISFTTNTRMGWHTPNYRAAPIASQPLHSWLSLPSLQELLFRRRNIFYVIPGTNSLSSSPSIQPSFLTRLSLYLPTNRQIIVDVLRNCPLIEECDVSVDTRMSPPTRDFSPITLPRLRCLGIEREDVSHDSLVSLLDVPSLVSLSVFLISFGTRLLGLLKRCPLLDKLVLDPCLMSPRAFLDVLRAAPNIAQLTLDHRPLRSVYVQDGAVSLLRKERPLGCKYDTHASLFRQEEPQHCESMAIYDNGILNMTKPNPLPEPPLPKLKSFTAIMKTGSVYENPHSLLNFLRSRIHPLGPGTSSTSSPPQSYPTSSLESIKLVLDGHPEVQSDTQPRSPLDLAAEVACHAASVGRTVGVDIFLDISYPWKGLYELGGWQKWKAPKILVSVKEGLDEETDDTWPYDY